MDLLNAQRRRLKALAHALQPKVLIGQRGLTEKVTEEINRALDKHELIKIRFLEHKSAKQEICSKIEEDVSAVLVGIVGHVAIFFRQNLDPNKRVIQI